MKYRLNPSKVTRENCCLLISEIELKNVVFGHEKKVRLGLSERQQQLVLIVGMKFYSLNDLFHIR